MRRSPFSRNASRSRVWHDKLVDPAGAVLGFMQFPLLGKDGTEAGLAVPGRVLEIDLTARWPGCGEVCGTRRKPLFARAKAFLIPIRWPEPFGIVMVDSLACGTPVIAFPEGAASEIVIDGENGFLVVDQQAVADAIGSLTVINPAPLP
jgi:glycosyltransferase involved in cell wall biosynthesis